MGNWKQIRGYPNYRVNEEGEIKNHRLDHILKQTMDSGGYMRVTISENGRQYSELVQRLVADTFLGEHPGMIVKHRDGDLTNNRIDNLYWTTRSELIKDAYLEGRKRPHNNKWIRVVETGRIYDSITACARDLGCDKSHIHRYLSGKCDHVKGYHFQIQNSKL